MPTRRRDEDEEDDFEVVEPKRKPRRPANDDFEVVEPKRKRVEPEDDEDDEPRPVKKKKKKKKAAALGPFDATYRDTNMAVLVLFAFCCSPIAIIHSTCALFSGRDDQARSNASLVLTIAIVVMVLNIIVRVVL